MSRTHEIVTAGGDMTTMWYRCSCGELSHRMNLDNGDGAPRAFQPWMTNHARETSLIAAQLDGYDLTKPTSITMVIGSTWSEGGNRGPSLVWYLAGLSKEQREDLAVGVDAWMGQFNDSEVDRKARELMVLARVLTLSPDDE